MFKYSEEFGIHTQIESSLIVPLTRKEEIKPFINDGNYHLYAICKRPNVRFDKAFTRITNEKKLKTNILLSMDKDDDEKHEFPAELHLNFKDGTAPYSHKLVSNNKEIVVYDSNDKLVFKASAALVLQESLDRTRHSHFENGETNDALIVDAICCMIGLEILYIGQSYGNGVAATTNAYERLEKHETLQKILVNLFNSPGEDVWLVLFSLKDEIDITRIKASTSQIADADKNQKHKDKVYDFHVSAKHLLTAVEALLIGYFRPEYNTEFNQENKLFPYQNQKYQGILDLNCNGFSLTLSTREKISTNRSVSTRIFTPKKRNYYAMHIIHTPMDLNRSYMYKCDTELSPVLFLNVLNELSCKKVNNPINRGF
ncbi:hypothetical protein [Bacillus sp. RIT694]|uniref:hypothetical protein n=1 Tax=Bacillus sp. RIT694 TaxID=2666190 RepID=UPI0012ACA892|nr:hypothetical protein [Bacillus sp. RIT694]MRS25599.1 hypothetical protein [Bacillus sp. RIT694]